MILKRINKDGHVCGDEGVLESDVSGEFVLAAVKITERRLATLMTDSNTAQTLEFLWMP